MSVRKPLECRPCVASAFVSPSQPSTAACMLEKPNKYLLNGWLSD